MIEPEKYAFEPFYDEVALALGRAVWAFSAIESLTFEFLQQLSTEPLHELMADQLFKSRTRLVRALVSRLNGFDSEKAVALAFLERAEKLAARRNAIAHNPWSVWADLDEKRMKAAIYSRKQGKPETIDSLRDFIVQAEEVHSGMQAALNGLPHVNLMGRLP